MTDSFCSRMTASVELATLYTTPDTIPFHYFICILFHFILLLLARVAAKL